MTRSTRQVLQLVGVALVALALVAAYLIGRGSSGSGGSAGGSEGTPTAGVGRSSSVAAGAVDPVSGLKWVDESSLPTQAKETLVLIRAGGPYPYPRNDDQTFGNREGLLPKKSTGYYKEYTVVTPGSQDRGERRIIKGADGELYYTADHYQSFRRIREGR
jgi:ribonuclease T1